MVPSGGYMAPALEQLGFKPYCFPNVYQRGNASTHPQEWASILEGKKSFDGKILQNKFDAIVGPPASIAFDRVLKDCPAFSIAFDRVLKDCPAFTKVVLVEEADKEGWARDVEQYVTPLLQTTKKNSKRSIGMHFHNMIVRMLPDDKKLGRVAALEMFEERVKRSVPEGRLLVYRLGDGWQPLCQFLDKPVPKDEDGNEAPFVSHNENGFECCSHLEDRIHRASRITWYAAFVLGCMSLVAFYPMLGGVSNLVKEYYQDYKLAFSSEIKTLQDEGREKDMTLRRAMVMSKKVTMEFEDKFKDKALSAATGGVLSAGPSSSSSTSG
eukprot:CAMPEP_0176439804 /NCGR_PEP_ID=MMETSP0127-20121128/20179_1 /TAXON_ID=938130 /ORGANISM="Platyophrya macrostoma, Strain WH" /LENGTH=324 /DNA_ID=CAMNT_0017824179 /DNA_START=25 /DNA_END=999 /DNA_ORIENTATION=-